jgi:hypothetical protein
MRGTRSLLGMFLLSLAATLSGPLDDWLFGLTGEEDTLPQLRGLAELALNPTRRAPQTAPYTLIPYADVNPFGINTFLQHEVDPERREEQIRLIAEAGFHWIRQEFPWEDIEIHGRGDFIDRRNDPAGIDAWEKYDQIVALAEEYGLEIIARLSNPPAWSRAAGDEMGPYAPPDDIQDYANFAATVAERYRGRIRYYQIWNEPNIYPEWGEQFVNAEAYTELLCAAAQAIREVDPEAVIISGALAPTNELTGRDMNDYIFLQRMYDAGAGECFDILSVQGYGLWSGPTDRRQQTVVVNYARSLYIRDIMVRNGDADTPIWISEMNWNAAPEDVEPRYGRVTLDQQARWAPLAYQRAEEEWPWVGVVSFWYFKRASDDWLDARLPEAYFQMMAPDFTPMPVYEAMRAYTAQTPVMYMGVHSPEHWAITWGGEEASFWFKGTSLAVALEMGGAITFAIDDGPARTMQVDGGETVVLWRGWRYESHSVSIAFADGAAPYAFIVRRRAFPWWAAAPVALISGGVYLWGRKKARDEQQAA